MKNKVISKFIWRSASQSISQIEGEINWGIFASLSFVGLIMIGGYCIYNT